MAKRGRRWTGEVMGVLALLASGAELGAQRARLATDPILRARWLAIACARAEQRDRLCSRLACTLPQGSQPQAGEASGELARLLRADLATSHTLAARCRRVARILVAAGNAEEATMLETVSAESLGHAAELARSLAHHYIREARTAAQ